MTNPCLSPGVMLATALLLAGCNFEQQLELQSDTLNLGQCSASNPCMPGASGDAGADTTAPVLSEVSRVPYGRNTTPAYTFHSDEAGSITYGGACSSATTDAAAGDNTITFNALAYAVYDDCTLTVTDVAGNVSAALAVSSFSVASHPVNDTGITLCGDYAYSYTGYTGSGTHNNNVNCTTGASPSSTASQEGFEIANGLDSVPAGQDAHFGRDAQAQAGILSKTGAGHAGFDFTKLSAVDGSPLAIQNVAWDDAGSEAAGSQWGCVQDNHTGLVWEVKVNNAAHLRHQDWTYTWYNSDATKNGGNVGSSTGTGCLAGANCNTQQYTADVNATSLCGFNDWRMPRMDELIRIVHKDRVSPAIDTAWFANTPSQVFWTASPYASNASNAWRVFFNLGHELDSNKSNSNRVRLVRGGY